MECSSEFVDVIMELMQAPFGDVMKSISQESHAFEGKYPGSALCDSVVQLQSHPYLFSMKPQAPKLINLEKRLEEGQQHACTVNVLRKHQCTSETFGNGVRVSSSEDDWTNNCAFDVQGQQEFEVKINRGAPETYVMLGIAPLDVNVTQASLYAQTVWCMQLHNRECSLFGSGSGNQQSPLGPAGSIVRMKLTRVNSFLHLQYAHGEGSYVTAFDNIPMGTYCPIVCFSVAGQSLTMESLPVHNGPKATMKREMQFLVTNRMEVLQSSATSAIELIAKSNGESLKGIHTETVRVTASSVRRMLAAALQEREDVLDFAFLSVPESSGRDSTVSSDSSDHSFELTIPSGSNTTGAT